jgi:hypothetical protein
VKASDVSNDINFLSTMKKSLQNIYSGKVLWTFFNRFILQHSLRFVLANLRGHVCAVYVNFKNTLHINLYEMELVGIIFIQANTF